MRVAQIAPLFESVPPQLYGGTERVVGWLTEELVRRGHQVTLFASGDSRTAADLVAVCPRSVRLEPGQPDAVALHLTELGRVLERASEFDVIHAHIDYLALPFGPLVRTPIVHTFHGRLDLSHLATICSAFPRAPLVSISHAQRAPLTHLDLNWVGTVYHGLPLETVPFQPEPAAEPYLAFVGRLSPEKRVDLAVAIAKRAGLPLRVAAKIDEANVPYFEREIRPLFDEPHVEYLGELGDEDKYALIGGALCLLFPIDWPEPFGLVMIEALACGTPVVARPCGSVPEVVRDGRTGFLGESLDDLVAGVKRIDLIDRTRCRADAVERFSVRAMTDGYEQVYARLTG